MVRKKASKNDPQRDPQRVEPSDGEEEKKVSRFDRFIHEFASKNLETRVKIVATIAILLIMATLLGGAYLVTRTFSIVETGSASISSTHSIMIPLDEKYEKLITPKMILLGQVKKKGLVPFKYEIQDVRFKEDEKKFLVKILLKSHLADLKGQKTFKYEIYLERRTYLSMLLEKGE